MPTTPVSATLIGLVHSKALRKPIRIRDMFGQHLVMKLTSVDARNKH